MLDQLKTLFDAAVRGGEDRRVNWLRKEMQIEQGQVQLLQKRTTGGVTDQIFASAEERRKESEDMYRIRRAERLVAEADTAEKQRLAANDQKEAYAAKTAAATHLLQCRKDAQQLATHPFLFRFTTFLRDP